MLKTAIFGGLAALFCFRRRSMTEKTGCRNVSGRRPGGFSGLAGGD